MKKIPQDGDELLSMLAEAGKHDWKWTCYKTLRYGYICLGQVPKNNKGFNTPKEAIQDFLSKRAD